MCDFHMRFSCLSQISTVLKFGNPVNRMRKSHFGLCSDVMFGFPAVFNVCSNKYLKNVLVCSSLAVHQYALRTRFGLDIMSWFRKYELNWMHSLCAKVLKAGCIPNHVAIILDGNRRYARMHEMDTIQGHLRGFEKFTESVHWCTQLGIREVTVYAFSIENFKRSRDEIAKLMYLAKEKFKLLLEERDKLVESGMRIQVLGNIAMLPKGLQRLVAEAMLITRDNTKGVLNICLAYTGRDDIFQSVKEICEGVEIGIIRPSDVSEQLLARCLYSGDSPEPDILLRTSGEIRLSDFLLWQTSYSVLAFVREMWPDLTIWRFFAAILYFQMHCDPAKCLKLRAKEHRAKLQLESDWQCAAQEIKATLSSECKHGGSGKIDAARVDEYREEREKRIGALLKHVDQKRMNLLQELMTITPD